MLTNADMTLYSWTGTGYSRQIIEEVYWQESKMKNIGKTGMESANAIDIIIPAGSILNGISFTTGKDFVIKDKITTDIDNTSEATVSTSMKQLKASHEIHTVELAEPRLFGSEDMHHYQLSCK